MKYADLETMETAGLITSEQKQRIAAHFKLEETEGSRFLAIVSYIGAALIAGGIVLLIAANWDAIPRGVKLVSGIVLMLGAHAGGWFLRERRDYPRSGEALHVVGAALFLGNIALLGQVYHLSSRAPNAFLLWWIGIAALPWLLRAKGLHVLALAAFCIWFGVEVNESSSLIYCGSQLQMLLYALLGIGLLGIGYLLRGTSYSEFAGPTEKLGLLGLVVAAYPLTWKGFLGWDLSQDPLARPWLFPGLVACTLLVLASGMVRRRDLSPQWRWTWGGCLAGLAGLLALAYYLPHQLRPIWDATEMNYFHWLATPALFIFALLQIQVGVQSRSRFMVNLGTALVALVMITAYVNLFGSMAQTGLVFLVGGVFLISLGIYLEKQRRALMRRMLTVPRTGGRS